MSEVSADNQQEKTGKRKLKIDPLLLGSTLIAWLLFGVAVWQFNLLTHLKNMAFKQSPFISSSVKSIKSDDYIWLLNRAKALEEKLKKSLLIKILAMRSQKIFA